jgi:hypothetical protein
VNHAEYNRAMNWQPSPYKLQNKWTFICFDGKQWPGVFFSKEAAIAAGERHIAAVMECIRYGSETVYASNDKAAK